MRKLFYLPIHKLTNVYFIHVLFFRENFWDSCNHDYYIQYRRESLRGTLDEKGPEPQTGVRFNMFELLFLKVTTCRDVLLIGLWG